MLYDFSAVTLRIKTSIWLSEESALWEKMSASMPYFGLIIDYLRSFLVFVFKVFSIINEKISAQNSILIATVLVISPKL